MEELNVYMQKYISKNYSSLSRTDKIVLYTITTDIIIRASTLTDLTIDERLVEVSLEYEWQIELTKYYNKTASMLTNEVVQVTFEGSQKDELYTKMRKLSRELITRLLASENKDSFKQYILGNSPANGLIIPKLEISNEVKSIYAVSTVPTSNSPKGYFPEKIDVVKGKKIKITEVNDSKEGEIVLMKSKSTKKGSEAKVECKMNGAFKMDDIPAAFFDDHPELEKDFKGGKFGRCIAGKSNK